MRIQTDRDSKTYYIDNPHDAIKMFKHLKKTKRDFRVSFWGVDIGYLDNYNSNPRDDLTAYKNGFYYTYHGVGHDYYKYFDFNPRTGAMSIIIHRVIYPIKDMHITIFKHLKNGGA